MPKDEPEKTAPDRGRTDYRVPVPLSLLMGEGVFAPQSDKEGNSKEGGFSPTSGQTKTRLMRKDGQILLSTIHIPRGLDQFDLSVLMSLVEVARSDSNAKVKTVVSDKLHSIFFKNDVAVNGHVMKSGDSATEEYCSIEEAVLALTPENSSDGEIILDSKMPRAVANLSLKKVARHVFGPRKELGTRDYDHIKSSLRKLRLTSITVMGADEDKLREKLKSMKDVSTLRLLDSYENLDYVSQKDMNVIEWEKQLRTYYNSGLIGNGGRTGLNEYRVFFSPVLSMHLAIASMADKGWKALNQRAQEDLVIGDLWFAGRYHNEDRRKLGIRNQRLLSVYQEVVKMLTFTHRFQNYTLDTMLRNIYGIDRYQHWVKSRAPTSKSEGYQLRKQRSRLKQDLVDLYRTEGLREWTDKKRGDFKHMLNKLGITLNDKD